MAANHKLDLFNVMLCIYQGKTAIIFYFPLVDAHHRDCIQFEGVQLLPFTIIPVFKRTKLREILQVSIWKALSIEGLFSRLLHCR